MGSFLKQRNLCIKLFRTEKRNFYKNLDISQITDNKMFWNTVKPFISNRNKAKTKITLIEDERIISKDEEVAETLNEYFVTVTDSLGCTENVEIITSTEGVTDPIDQASRNSPTTLASGKSAVLCKTTAYSFSIMFRFKRWKRKLADSILVRQRLSKVFLQKF